MANMPGMKAGIHILSACLFLSATLVRADDSPRGIKVVTNSQGEQVCLYKESHALLIGVSNYTAGWADLDGVTKDIPRVKAALEKQGFDIVTVMNPTKDDLEDSVASFISKYGRDKDNRLLVYYSGHGYTLTKSWGGDMGYIVPADAPDPAKDKNGFMDKAVDMLKVEGWAKNIDSKHAMFMFDSCFSGSLFSMSKAAPAIINYKTSQPVRQFITAGGEDETVPDKSIFCQQFLDALNGEGDGNGDGYITGSELGEYLQSTVVNYSYDGQHPQYGKIRDRRLDKGDFVFTGVTSKTPSRLKHAAVKPSSPPLVSGSQYVDVLSGEADPSPPAGWVQWKVQDGGNGHWYKGVSISGGIRWQEARQAAESRGGYLATITSAEENTFVYRLSRLSDIVWAAGYSGPWLGGFQADGSKEPDGGWRWVSGEPWRYTAWASREPSNTRNQEKFLQYNDNGAKNAGWNDVGYASPLSDAQGYIYSAHRN